MGVEEGADLVSIPFAPTNELAYALPISISEMPAVDGYISLSVPRILDKESCAPPPSRASKRHCVPDLSSEIGSYREVEVGRDTPEVRFVLLSHELSRHPHRQSKWKHILHLP